MGEGVFAEQQGVCLLFNERLDNLFARSVSSVEFSTGGCELLFKIISSPKTFERSTDF